MIVMLGRLVARLLRYSLVASSAIIAGWLVLSLWSWLITPLQVPFYELLTKVAVAVWFFSYLGGLLVVFLWRGVLEKKKDARIVPCVAEPVAVRWATRHSRDLTRPAPPTSPTHSVAVLLVDRRRG
jgi:hypothetical protein